MSEASERKQEIFTAALLLPAEERPAFLAAACGADPGLRAQVEDLLRAHAAAGAFMDVPEAGRDGVPGPGEPPSAGEEKSGVRIGRYRLQQKIGEGGCGTVWMAEQEEPVHRIVALKIIKLGMDTAEVIARFEAERQALALLEHANIAKILDAGATEAGRPYFVMELVRGIKITDFCDRYNLTTAQRLELFSQVCQGVQHAHQKGIIHRDLKPSNVLVTLVDGVPAVKVIDFGIAKATAGRLTDRTLFTAFEQFMGTPSYMSPEQAELSGIDVDTRSDVYSLGVLLYELLSGRLPFDPKSLVKAGLDEIRRIIREVEPPKPSTNLQTLENRDREQVARVRSTDSQRLSLLLRGDLDWIVMRCLEKNRARRYETPDALAADIGRHLRNEPVVARPASRLYRLNRLIRRNRLVFAAAAAVLTALVTGLALSAWQAVRATRAEHVAEQERIQAVAERARAEDLLKFMLGDLYTQLDRVGKLELLDSVADKANAYFASLQPGVLDATTQFSRARALRLLAAVRMNQGRSAEAAKAVGEAYARVSALVAQNPRDGDALFERGETEYLTGYIFFQAGDLTSTDLWWTRSRDTAKSLVALEPARSEWQLELADAFHNVAVLKQQEGDLAGAAAGFAGLLATLGQLEKIPSLRLDVQSREAAAQADLGGLADAEGNFRAALVDYSREAEVLTALVRADPKAAQPKQDRALAFLNVMTADMELGQLAEARRAWADGHPLLDGLIAIDGTDVYLAKLRIIGLLAEVSLDMESGDLEAAEQVADRALPLIVAVRQRATDDRMVVRLLARVWRQKANLQLRSHEPQALNFARSAMELGEQLRTQNQANDGDVAECAADHNALGEALAEFSSAEAARKEWLRAAELLPSKGSDSRNWRLLDPAIRAAARLGREDEARTWIARLNLLGYVPVEPWPRLGTGDASK